MWSDFHEIRLKNLLLTTDKETDKYTQLIQWKITTEYKKKLVQTNTGKIRNIGSFTDTGRPKLFSPSWHVWHIRPKSKMVSSFLSCGKYWSFANGWSEKTGFKVFIHMTPAVTDFEVSPSYFRAKFFSREIFF